MDTRWKPNVTVAAIIEREGRFLLVEEQTADGLRLNNPAGHLDRGETPLLQRDRTHRDVQFPTSQPSYQLHTFSLFMQ